MKIGITGGTGTISRFITASLLASGNEVYVFQHSAASRHSYPGAKWIICDRYNSADFKEKLRATGGLDCLIDMICYNPQDAQSLLEACRGRVEHLIFCSTVDVFSKDPPNYPYTADSKREPRPSFSYGYNKALCEKMLEQEEKAGGFHMTILRPTASYSEGGSPLVHAFRGGSYHLDRIQKGKKIILHGDGSSVWCATHAKDLAGVFVNAVCNPKVYRRSYNIIGDEMFSFKQYYSMAAQVLNAPPINFVYISTALLYKMDPQRSEWCMENFCHNNIFDNSDIKRDLGFSYTISWKEGLRSCVKHMLQNGGFENSDEPQFSFYDKIIEIYESHENQIVAEYNAK